MFKINIEQWVPKFILDDKNGYALAKAIEAALQYMNDKVEEGFNCLTNTDEMPEWRLDELAWEYCCPYDYSADITAKRRWIHDAEKLYSMYSILQATSILSALKKHGSMAETPTTSACFSPAAGILTAWLGPQKPLERSRMCEASLTCINS